MKTHLSVSIVLLLAAAILAMARGTLTAGSPASLRDWDADHSGDTSVGSSKGQVFVNDDIDMRSNKNVANSDNASVASNGINLVLADPDIDLVPLDFEFTVNPFQIDSSTLDVANQGDGTLDWSLELSTGSTDILGDWNVIVDFGCDGSPGNYLFTFNSDFTFTGGPSGGTWEQMNNLVTWTFADDVTILFTGYVAGSALAGTVISDSFSGCWEAERLTAGTASSKASERTISGEVAPDPGDITTANVTSGVAEQAVSAWLTANPDTGSLTGNSSDAVTVGVDSTSLSLGMHYGLIRVKSNDSGEVLIAIPVKLTVINYKAEFTGSPTSGQVNLTVNFTNQSEGPYTTCSWNFGDGGTSTTCTNPSHTYKLPDTYTVKLTVSGPGGSDTKTRTSYITVSNVVADFTASSTIGFAKLPVTFTNNSSGTFTTCSWDFGDGGKSTSCGNPTHTYTEKGIFTVKLTVGGPGYSDTRTRTNYINVEDSRVLIPIVGSNLCSGFRGPREQEPNEKPGLANGPLCFLTTYKGSPDDDHPEFEEDWFYFFSTGGHFTVSVTNFLKNDAQVQLYYKDSKTLITHQGDQASGNYILPCNSLAGRYLIRVFAGANHPKGSGDYNLRVIVP